MEYCGINGALTLNLDERQADGRLPVLGAFQDQVVERLADPEYAPTAEVMSVPRS